MMLSGCVGEAAMHSLSTPGVENKPRGLKRCGGGSPFSSNENLVHLAKVQASCTIQRAVRRAARRRRALKEANYQPPPRAGAHAPCASGTLGTLNAPQNGTEPGIDSSVRARRAALGAALLCALAANVPSASASEEMSSAVASVAAASLASAASAAAPLDGLVHAPDADFVEELDTVAAAEAAAAAEAGLQSSARSGTRALFGANGGAGQLERAVLAVLFRAVLAKVASEEHLDAVLSTDLGSHFAASLLLGTACGVLARGAAAWLAPAHSKQTSASPRLPPRRGALRGAPLLRGMLSGGGLARAFGVGAVQLLAFDALRAAEAAASAELPQDGGLLLAGALAGGVAAAAAQPMDAAAAAVRNAARAALRGSEPESVTRALLALDVGAFLALEAACARLGLDPVPAL